MSLLAMLRRLCGQFATVRVDGLHPVNRAQEAEEQRRLQDVWSRLELVGKEIESIARREGSRP